MSVLKKLWKKNAGAKREVFPRGKNIPAKLKKISIKDVDDDPDKPSVSLQFISMEGKDKDGNDVAGGLVTWKNFDLFDRSGSNDKGDWEIKGEEQARNLMIDLDTCGFDTEENEIEEIMAAIDEEPQPVYLTVVENKNNPEYSRIYINDIIPEDELPEDEGEEYEDEEEEDVEEEEDEELEEEDEEDEEDAEEGDEEEYEDEEEESDSDDEEYEDEEYEDEEEESEPITPTRGMVVMAKPPKCRNTAEYKVVAVKVKAQLCKLKSMKDPSKVYEDVSFDAIESEVETE